MNSQINNAISLPKMISGIIYDNDSTIHAILSCRHDKMYYIRYFCFSLSGFWWKSIIVWPIFPIISESVLAQIVSDRDFLLSLCSMNLTLISSWDSITSFIDWIHPSVTPAFPTKTIGLRSCAFAPQNFLLSTV